MDELQEVITREDAEQIMGDLTEEISAEIPTSEEMQGMAETAATEAAGEVSQSVADTVANNNDVLVGMVAESVRTELDEAAQRETKTTVLIDSSQYDEMVAACRNASTVIFLQLVFTCMLIGVILFQQFRGHWG